MTRSWRPFNPLVLPFHSSVQLAIHPFTYHCTHLPFYFSTCPSLLQTLIGWPTREFVRYYEETIWYQIIFKELTDCDVIPGLDLLKFAVHEMEGANAPDIPWCTEPRKLHMEPLRLGLEIQSVYLGRNLAPKWGHLGNGDSACFVLTRKRPRL